MERTLVDYPEIDCLLGQGARICFQVYKGPFPSPVDIFVVIRIENPDYMFDITLFNTMENKEFKVWCNEEIRYKLAKTILKYWNEGGFTKSFCLKL